MLLIGVAGRKYSAAGYSVQSIPKQALSLLLGWLSPAAGHGLRLGSNAGVRRQPHPRGQRAEICLRARGRMLQPAGGKGRSGNIFS